jgi:septum site-determining protein MinD
MGKIIAVVSGKGGTGKTTAVGAIGSCLGAMGRKTLCVDCDFGLRNLDITLGMTNRAVADLVHVLTGVCDIKDACVKHPTIENLWFLSAPPTYESEFDMNSRARLLSMIRGNFDYCLLDAPAGIGSGFNFAASGADMAIIVATGDAASVRDGQVVSGRLRELGISDVRLLVNRVSPAMYSAVGATVDSVIDTIGAQLIGIIREDSDVPFSANLEIPLVLYSRRRAARGFLRAARRIDGQRVPVSAK